MVEIRVQGKLPAESGAIRRPRPSQELPANGGFGITWRAVGPVPQAPLSIAFQTDKIDNFGALIPFQADIVDDFRQPVENGGNSMKGG